MLVDESLLLDEMHILKSDERRRSLGAFYTPSFLSKLLCQWAIRKKDDVVLEPSFGGCTFLEEIADRFLELGLDDPLESVYGCDIDKNAFAKLETLKVYSRNSNFLLKDFLQLESVDFCQGKADVVIGNPPYIGSSQISVEQRKTLELWKKSCGMDIEARSSLWVYFFIHALTFLKAGARLAFVLPGSFLSSDYAKKIHELIKSRFDRSLVVSLAERIFVAEGAEERTVILLAEGYRSDGFGKGVVKVAHSPRLLGLPKLFESWRADEQVFDDFDNVGIGSFLARSASENFFSLCARLPCIELGSIAAVSIGIVTGDTRFFIRTLSEWRQFGIDERFYKFVVPKIKGIAGVNLTKSQVKSLISSDVRCLLLDTSSHELSGQVLKYLSSYPVAKHGLATYKKRVIWHQPDDKKTPDGFFTFLTHNGPRIVLNSAKVNCTNSVHRVFLKEKLSKVQLKLVALSMLSTFTQTHAEIIGRPCGSGALKLEPKDALQLKLLYPDDIDPELITKAFKDVQNALDKSPPDESGARKIADLALAKMIKINFDDEILQLEQSLKIAREHRKGNVESNHF
ncbi:N-6 DNA Methylase [Pseudomonas taetrolens]|uniref:site-specific DNA-methyltransferase (adenine-specific) n=2 Tax=Pseudomonas taetrolens TaxID=47884 RepID=A0A1H4LG42_PSETA|nr:N-6 DNA methylase [Pseudomonas taetrolens]SEB69650.1 N-6 DNA Methylase [Pseudomonas taetrolens]SQF85167.1 Modification methylase Eco57IB [Pseudomonas taetrolens]VEH47853.1 Modification methylase Eco57IB [Pseudomonas taetrolens]